MEVKFNLTDKEVMLLSKLLNYQESTVEDVEVEDEETGEVRLESQTVQNPYTREQFVGGAFVAYKDKWIETAIARQVHEIIQLKEKELSNPTNIKAISEAVKEIGIENINEILKSKL